MRNTNSPLLSHLAKVYRANPDAEVSGPEVQALLGLDAVAVRSRVAELACRGLVEWDPLLSNIWVRITDLGLAAVEDAESASGDR